MDKADCERTVVRLMNEWGLQFPNWRLKFFNGPQFGTCGHEGKHGGVLGLNEFFVTHNSEAIVMDTAKHEIAHALVGPGNGHNAQWKEMAVRIGCVPTACKFVTHLVLPPARWTTICPQCQNKYQWIRRPKYFDDPGRYSCRVCDTFLVVVDNHNKERTGRARSDQSQISADAAKTPITHALIDRIGSTYWCITV